MAVEQVQGQGQGQGQGQLRGQAAPPASLLRHTDHTCAAPATPVQHPLPVLGPGPLWLGPRTTQRLCVPVATATLKVGFPWKQERGPCCHGD